MELSSRLDVLALAASGVLVLGYYVYLLIRMRSDPEFSIHTVNQKARLLWVLDVMSKPEKEVLAVQTLRNMAMGAIFKASTASLLILGTLTLSGQAESLIKTWHLLNLGGSQAPGWWVFKILCLLTVLIVAFFAFAMSIRLLNHVVFMINLPVDSASGSLTPEKIAMRLNRAAAYYSIGMRAFFIAVPLVFWLFGPLFLVVATMGLVVVLYWLDRNPLDGND